MDDHGVMERNVEDLANLVVGHRIVGCSLVPNADSYRQLQNALVITLDNGKRVRLANTYDCCAYTEIESFLMRVHGVDHIITGVTGSGDYTKWRIYADLGDILTLQVGWSSGNPGYYGYGFDIEVMED